MDKREFYWNMIDGKLPYSCYTLFGKNMRPNQFYKKTWEQIRAAISKARGES